MNTFESRSRVPQALVKLGCQRPRTVLLGWLVLAAVFGWGVKSLRVETTTDSVLDHSSESWRFYQESQRLFGGDEILTLLLEGDTPFDPDVLDDVSRISEEFENLAGIRRVYSLSTVPLVRSTVEGDLDFSPPLRERAPRSTEEIAEFAKRVRADRIAPRTLVSSDERSFAVNLVLEAGAEDHYAAIFSQIEQSTHGKPVWVSGVPVFRVAADSRTRADLTLFVPLTIGVIGLLLAFFFRSPQAVIIPLASSGIGTWIMLGTMGALDVPITITTVILPSILLALGCAYSVHLLCAASNGKDSEQVQAMLEVSLPIALSGLTTTLGFLAISFVRIDAIRNVGVFGAIGVFVVLAITLTAGPAALTLWPLPERRSRLQSYLQERATPSILRLANQHRRPVILLWLAAMALVAVGIGRLVVETDAVLWFQRDDPIRVAYSEIRDRLSGISPINVVIESTEERGLNHVEVMSAIDQLSAYLQGLPDVGRVLSIADPMRQLHGGFVGDPQLPMPTRDDMVSQYLVLLESKRFIHDLITPDWRSANVLLRVNDNRSGTLIEVARAAERWWVQNGVPGYTARATGIMFEFARSEDAIAMGQLRGLAFALLAVSGILFAIFRWARLAWIALAPNVVPIVMGFGAMGLLGIPLDAGTVLIGGLAFGIAVDDSIHAVTSFYKLRIAGGDVPASLSSAYRMVLPPLVYTTLVVALGFSVLALSDFTLIRHLGLLTAGLMIFCLLADLLLLPALLSGVGNPPARAIERSGGRLVPGQG